MKWACGGVLAMAIPSSVHAATVYLDFQDQDPSDVNDGGPAYNYSLSTGSTGSADISITGMLSSPLSVDFSGMYVSDDSNEALGYPLYTSSSLYGNDSIDTITFNQPVTNVEFHISAYGADPAQYSPTTGVSIVGTSGAQPEFTYTFPQGIDDQTAGDWYLVSSGDVPVETITFYDFSGLPVGDLLVTTVPEPAWPGVPILVSSLFLLSRRAARRKSIPAG
jgi:hypothetical protein